MKYTSLSKWAVEKILPILINKKVWTHKLLWKGFIEFCKAAGKECCGVLLLLPIEKLADFFKSAPSFTSLLQTYAAENKIELPEKIKSVLESNLSK